MSNFNFKKLEDAIEKTFQKGIKDLAKQKIKESGSTKAKYKSSGSILGGTYKGQIEDVTDDEAKKISD